MQIPRNRRKSFEINGYYEHMGGHKVHIIAITKFSDMWLIEPGKVMYIGETRCGKLIPLSCTTSNCNGWYKINYELFRCSLMFKEYKFGSMNKFINGNSLIVPRFNLRIYQNNEIYLFDLYNHFDNDGLLPNILKDDVNGIFNNIDDFLTKDELLKFEKLVLQKI